MADTVRVRGLRELQVSLKHAEKSVKKEVREALREVGDIVRDEAASRFDQYDAGSASGFKVRVRQRGVAVEQSRRKTTGKRGDYGSLQMRRGLLPAAESKSDEAKQEMEHALDKIADIVKGA